MPLTDHHKHLLEKAARRHQNGNTASAIHLYKRVLKQIPDDASVLSNYGAALNDQFDYRSALTVFARAYEIAPETTGLLNNYANAHLGLGHFGDAIALFKQALELSPDDPVLLKNLGNAYHQSGDFTAAIRCFDQTLENDVDNAQVHCLKGFSLAALGRLDECWKAYQWRWKIPDAPPPRPYTVPIWDGSDPGGKSLIIWGEQGIGDEILFAGLIHDVLKLNGKVAVECEPRLKPLFERAFPGISVIARRQEKTADNFHFQIPAGDLPALFRPSLSSFTANTGYLKSDPDKTAALRRTYLDQTGAERLIGISWLGGSDSARSQRSLELADWKDFLQTFADDTAFISLQYGDVASEINQFNKTWKTPVLFDESVDPLADMDGAACQTAAMDHIITVANATAHLAGALNVKGFVLHPANADWIWLLQNEKSPWYPSLRHIRQPDPGQWSGIFDTLVCEFSNC